MLKTVRKAFQIEDIRKRIFYTFVMLVIVRLGSQLPTPGVDPTFIKEFFAQQTGDAFNFFEAFTGGSFTNFSIFALSITPYITSSIIMQLLTIAIPKLEEMQKEGEEGRKKIAAITRYVTVALALIESTAMAVGFGRAPVEHRHELRQREDHHDKPGHLFHRLNHQLRQVGLAANFAGGDAVCQRHDKEEKDN